VAIGHRVDSPHALTSVDESGAGGVLTFVADPSALGFASLGEDGVVRFWRPKIRRRNGIEIRGKNAEVLISWHCQHVVQLENTSQQRKLAGASPRASMAFQRTDRFLQCLSNALLQTDMA
jgi:NET1-associated nuclear protein 1 (U3 small nucleolar RNA-associated protein 17)